MRSSTTLTFLVLLSVSAIAVSAQQPSARQPLPASQTRSAQRPAPGQQVHRDAPFQQRYSIKYELSAAAQKPGKISCDRNGVIQIVSPSGLLKPSGGSLLHPGRLVPDPSYAPLTDMHIRSIGIKDNELVYLDDHAIFSNAWAGKLYLAHTLPDARLFSSGPASAYLLSDGRSIQYLEPGKTTWTGNTSDRIIDILYDGQDRLFWILGENSVTAFSPQDHSLQNRYTGSGLTCFALDSTGKLIIGYHGGYITMPTAPAPAGTPGSAIHNSLPCNDLTVIRIIGGQPWFGSTEGAFTQYPDGHFDYFASKRWIPSDRIIDIAAGNDGEVLLLSDQGLGIIHSKPMTLQDKAIFFDHQVRARHIRNGFNATISRMKNGDPDTGILEDSDNDGLWTAMYLGAEAFRYSVTRSREALENCRASLDAMERLYALTPVKGFPARSFERRGYESADTQVWRKSADPRWDWKSTTSSDEAIGHIFAFGVLAEIVDDADIRSRAIRLIDTLMGHIVTHDLYMIDWNGQPTKWARWNPEYVNVRPLMVGDRKITSSNIIAMLQTAWHFTHKKIYRDKALELMHKYGYLDNLMRPMKQIGMAPENADQLSKDLSDGWNHSDDEMYFLGYWGLYRYALNDTLRTKYKAAILDHWEIERPEKEAAWDIVTAMTGVSKFDLPEAIGYLQRYPLDLVSWQVTNSKRKDLVHIAHNFRKQSVTKVLPPDELPIARHNSNQFDLDGGENGQSEYSAGDIWLLPYWMGRYLGVITPATPATPAASK